MYLWDVFGNFVSFLMNFNLKILERRKIFKIFVFGVDVFVNFFSYVLCVEKGNEIERVEGICDFVDGVLRWGFLVVGKIRYFVVIFMFL